jgi:hypothetical protein
MTTAPRRNPVLPMPRTRRGKILFALGLILWFSVLMLPCGLFWFASGGEIILHHANIPEPVTHPLLQIGTVMNSQESGMQITTSYITTQTDTDMCVQTNVSYLLWKSRSENPNTSFCDCYQRENESWLATSTTSGNCP